MLLSSAKPYTWVEVRDSCLLSLVQFWAGRGCEIEGFPQA